MTIFVRAKCAGGSQMHLELAGHETPHNETRLQARGRSLTPRP